ncbi:MAG: InlB B-repeat-containing protein [Lachnospiraceae bacterium]
MHNTWKNMIRRTIAVALTAMMVIPMIGISTKAEAEEYSVTLPAATFQTIKCAGDATDSDIAYLRGTGNDQSEGAYAAFDASALDYDKITIKNIVLHCDQVENLTSDVWLKLYQSTDGTYQGNNINKNGKSISGATVVDVIEAGSNGNDEQYIYVPKDSTSFDCYVGTEQFQKTGVIGLHLVKTGGSAKPNLSKTNMTLTVTYVLGMDDGTSDDETTGENGSDEEVILPQTVIDFSTNTGVSHRVASGALHAFDYKTPAQYLTDGIYLRAIRGQAHQYDFDNTYEYLPGFFDEPTYNRLLFMEVKPEMMIGLYYGYKGEQKKLGTDWQTSALENNGAIWRAYIKDLMSEAYNEDATPSKDIYSWIPFNEPDLQWKNKLNDFYKAYQNAYEAVKEFDGTAKVQGPEWSSYDFSKIKDFLLYCKKNNCLPDVLSWHEIRNYKLNIDDHCKELYEFMIEYDIDPMPMAVTEYQGQGYKTNDAGRKSDGNYNTGLTIAYISEMERAEEYGFAYGLQSAWGLSGDNPEAKAYLGEMTDFETGTMPTGLWYVYHHYKDMTGHKVNVSLDEAYIEGHATVDTSIDTMSASALLGNWAETEYQTEVVLDQLPEVLTRAGNVHVTMEAIPETLGVPLYKTTTILDEDVVLTDHTYRYDLTIPARCAVSIRVTPITEEAIVMPSEIVDMPQTAALTTDGTYRSITGLQPPSYLNGEKITYVDNGDSITLTGQITDAGYYTIKSMHKTGTDKGFMQLYLDGKAYGKPIDLYETSETELEVSYGRTYLTAGEHTFTYKLVGYGKNKASSDYNVNIGDILLLRETDAEDTITITFDDGETGAKVSQDNSMIKTNTSIGNLPEATLEGKRFLGWSTTADGDVDVTTETVFTSDTVLYPIFETYYEATLQCNIAHQCEMESDGEQVTLITDNVYIATVTANGIDISEQVVYAGGKATVTYTMTEDTTFHVTLKENELRIKRLFLNAVDHMNDGSKTGNSKAVTVSNAAFDSLFDCNVDTTAYETANQKSLYIDLGKEYRIKKIVVHDTAIKGTLFVSASKDIADSGFVNLMRANGSTSSGLASTYTDITNDEGIAVRRVAEVDSIYHTSGLESFRYLKLHDWSNYARLSELEIYVVSDSLKGDMNNDEKLSAVDAMLALHAVGAETMQTELVSQGDMNDDNQLTSEDVQFILDYVAK